MVLPVLLLGSGLRLLATLVVLDVDALGLGRPVALPHVVAGLRRHLVTHLLVVVHVTLRLVNHRALLLVVALTRVRRLAPLVILWEAVPGMWKTERGKGKKKYSQ